MEEQTNARDAEDILSEFNKDSQSKSDVIPDTPTESIIDETGLTDKLATDEKTEDKQDEKTEDKRDEKTEDKRDEKTEDKRDEKTEDKPRNIIFVGKKPIMTYVNATLTQLSVLPVVTIKARGKSITQAVDISQMIVKRMSTVGYFVKDVRISSDSLTSKDGKTRNVSTIEVDLSHK